MQPDFRWAEKTLQQLLHVTGPTGRERAVSEFVRTILLHIGVPKSAVRNDGCAKKIPLATEVGNLIALLPGRGILRNAPRLLFAAHLDTVDIAAGTRPRRQGRFILGSPGHALGADDRAGVATVLSMVHTLMKTDAPHPPITVLFTVREESGLWGARTVDLQLLKRPAMGFSFDGERPDHVLVKAPGSDRMDIVVHGIAAHAGGDPEKGVSAAVIASLAIADLHEKRLHGLIAQGPQRTTSNIGSINGGVFHNIVCPEIKVVAEARSYNEKRLARVVAAYRRAFTTAVRKAKSSEGRQGSLDFRVERLYYPFCLDGKHAVVKHALAAMKAVGITGRVKPCKGGLDANWLIRHGIPTVTIGSGMLKVHTVEERLDLGEFRRGCLVAASLATLRGQ